MHQQDEQNVNNLIKLKNLISNESLNADLVKINGVWNLLVDFEHNKIDEQIDWNKPNYFVYFDHPYYAKELDIPGVGDPAVEPAFSVVCHLGIDELGRCTQYSPKSLEEFPKRIRAALEFLKLNDEVVEYENYKD